MGQLKVILELLNGKKSITGIVMILAVYLMQQLGIDKSEATNIATNILLATGSVFTAWGYIHRWVKGKKK